MHQIQKHILKKVSTDKKCRYSDLKPKNVEGNLFVYHLKSLMREGYLEIKSEKYSLTPAGQRFMDRVSFETMSERIQPKIVTLLVIEKDKKYLLYKRRRSPFAGYIGFPYGKIHLEERLLEASHRELLEKTGLNANLKHRGEVYISVNNETELISHMLCHVFTGKNPSGNLKTDTLIGECFWGKIDEIPKNKLIPGVTQILKLLKNSTVSKRFFGEYFLNIGDE